MTTVTEHTANDSIGPVQLSSTRRHGLRAAALAGLTFAAIIASDGDADTGDTCWTPGMTRGKCETLGTVQVMDL